MDRILRVLYAHYTLLSGVVDVLFFVTRTFHKHFALSLALCSRCYEGLVGRVLFCALSLLRTRRGYICYTACNMRAGVCIIFLSLHIFLKSFGTRRYAWCSPGPIGIASTYFFRWVLPLP